MDEVVFASTTPGLEPALELEARALGAAQRFVGGVEISGRPGLHRRANLWLRTASRVLLRLGVVHFKDAAELERKLAALPLAPFRQPGAPLAIETDAHHSRVHGRELQTLAARALRAAGAGAALSLRLRIDGDSCTASVDASGELLHRRGYRQEISRAPMRETLAAGLLLLAGYSGSEPFWDPLCGSGTLAIEAGLIALSRAPGLARRFAFEDWPSHDAVAWAGEKARAAGLARPAQPLRASDLHAGALGTARRNARRAGFEGLIELFRHDATQPAKGVPEAGLLAANLPFGVRVGDRSQLGRLHRSLGAAFRQLRGWRAALLVASGSAEQELGWTPEHVFRLENGGIQCRLLVGKLG